YIKPENVMVRTDGYVKVLDFGLAKLTEPDSLPPEGETELSKSSVFETREGVILGTVAYMSPEQARGEKVDARSDLFSLGVTLYELIAGARPFAGATTNHILVSIIDYDPPSLARAPAALQQIVSRALRKDREGRYQSAKELLADLERFKDDLAAEAQFERGKTGREFGPPTGAGDVAVTTGPATERKTSGAHALLGQWTSELRQGNFVRRHRWGVAASALIVLSLIGGAVF